MQGAFSHEPVLVLDFPGFIFRVWPIDVETTFKADGSTLEASEQDNEEYLQTARQNGYGDDRTRLCREHELAHNWLADKRGLGVSPALWFVTHREMRDPPTLQQMQDEEWLVLDFQRYCNTGEVGERLQRLAEEGYDIAALRGEFVALTADITARVAAAA